MEKKNLRVEENWKHVAFTDEMSIVVGGTFGMSFGWRDKTEKWHQDCVGAMKSRGQQSCAGA